MPKETKFSHEKKSDPDFFPGFAVGSLLGTQHILAMFVGNITPAIIVAAAGGFGFGSNDPSTLIYMLQISMLFAGLATLLQTVGIGVVGARLPIVQGTSFAFLPVMIPLVADQGIAGMAAIMTGAFASGIFHTILGLWVGKIRIFLPPLITGLVVAMIGLSLLKVGVQYASGGAPLKGTEAYGAPVGWLLAMIVVISTVGLKFFTKGLTSMSAVLLGLVAGYIAAASFGKIDLSPISNAGLIALPRPFIFGFELSIAAIIGFCFMTIVSTVETIGDVNAITESGMGRPASDKELSGATFADGIGTSISAIFGGLPNTSFSQNVGVVAMTGIMSRHVVTLGACVLIICGFLPKIGAALTTIPIEVLGGSVIILFGLIVSAAMRILSDVVWTDKNMMIFGLSISLGLGLLLESSAVQWAPKTLQILLGSGILPAALLAIILNILLPEKPVKA